MYSVFHVICILFPITGEVYVTYIPGPDALVHQESAMIQLKKETEPDTSESEREDEIEPNEGMQ